MGKGENDGSGWGIFIYRVSRPSKCPHKFEDKKVNESHRGGQPEETKRKLYCVVERLSRRRWEDGIYRRESGSRRDVVT